MHHLNSSCGCECKNDGARRQCLISGMNWSEETCQCDSEKGLAPDDSHSDIRLSVIITVLSISIILLLCIIISLVRRILVIRRRVQLQENLRHVHNIDTFYEFMTKRGSDCSDQQTLNTTDVKADQSDDSDCLNDYSFESVTNPIDEALLILKLSSDQL